MDNLDESNIPNNVKLPDEDLKLKEIDQLHAAVTQFGNKCFEIKKLFATLILGVITFAIKFNGDKIDYKILGIVMIITVIFWILDAESYYYQEKLRRTMSGIMDEIRGGRGLQPISRVGMPIDANRSKNNMRVRSFTNESQTIYKIVFAIVIIVGLLLYVIK